MKVTKMTKSIARQILGSLLSATSKMPCYSFNLSALHCKVGSKLAKIKNSVCYGCYALKGNYARYKLPQKMVDKTKQIAHPLWVNAMVYLLNNQGNKKDKNYFRWHDSGDIQDIEHLKKIVQVCKLTPQIMHWIPTREYSIVKKYMSKYGAFPDNLVVRLSAHMVDSKPPQINNLPTSSVNKDQDFIGVQCQSYKNNNECGDCRLCWMPNVKNISYKYH
tara:strand:+ start:290 stop:946 length:657 start_codon:yes stop_codon:yes gene_type:complete